MKTIENLLTKIKKQIEELRQHPRVVKFNAFFRPKLQKFKQYVTQVVNNRFNGDWEKAAIALTAAIGLFLALLIVLMDKGSSGAEHESEHGDEHGHDEEMPTIELSQEALAASAIELSDAKSGKILRSIKLRGIVVPNRDRYVEITPRFSGVVLQVKKNYGDDVAKGETLATIESAAARSTFAVQSGIPGVVVEKNAVRGVFVSDSEPVFTVVDLSNVWVELDAADIDADMLKVGQKIQVTDVEAGIIAETSVSYVSPLVEEDSQSILVRAVIENPDRKWRPGAFVDAIVYTEEIDSGVTIANEAVQILDNQTVVFVKNHEEFVARPVKVGRQGGDLVEVLEGMKEGDKYIAKNSFIAKSELLKSTAEHEH